jgi:hypothetical protein
MRVGLIAVLFFCFLYFFALQIEAIWPFTIDDMYITLRYAKHWAEGSGLVWNVGEHPVEGYSNFSYLLLARLAGVFHLNPVFTLKITGVVALFLLTIALFFISRLWVLSRFAWIPSLWLLGYCGQIIWSVSGLETTLYQVLLAGSVYFILNGLGYRAYPKPVARLRVTSFVIAGVLLSMAGMTRPEGIALILLFLSVVGFYAWRDPSVWRGFLILLSITLITYLPYFVWRVSYFGHLFPNPVYCKGFTEDWNFLLDKQYLQLIWPFVLCAIPLALYTREKGFLFLSLPSVLYLILCINASTLVAFYNRLFLPAFALFLPLAAISIVKACKRMGLIYVVSGFLFVFIPMKSLDNYRYFSRNPQRGEQLRKQVVSWLSANTTKAQQVVLSDSGFIPYYSTLNFIDSYCLNNEKMAHDSNGDMYIDFCHELLLQKPAVIILTSRINEGIVEYTPTDACLAHELKNSHEYRSAAIFRTQEEMGSYYQYGIYIK